MKAADRAIVNAIILYGKAVLTAGLILLSTRWVLEALGEEDFGIYNLVGGIIAMFSFLNVAMVSASQRFMSYSLGKGIEKETVNTFRTSVVLHIIIGIVVLILFEIMGQYLMFHHLKIPQNKLTEAVNVLHFLSITAFFTITTVPYQAVLTAHENMLTISLINIYESILKLIIAILLLRIASNRLEIYALAIMVITATSMIITRWYCHKKYSETKGNPFKIVDKSLFKKMFSFAGWNFIGSISSLLRNQGLAMLMNSFFGLVVNASYGIATQINGQAQFFSRTIIRSLQPQIAKSEGASDRQRMLRIALTTSKIPFLMMAMIAVPLIQEMNLVLKIWLTEIPEYAVSFCQLILLTTLVSQLKMGLSVAIDSVGKIKWYQIICGGLHFIVLPIAFILFKMGYSPVWGVGFIFIEEFIVVCLTEIVARRETNISTKEYYRHVFIPCLAVVCGSWAISLISTFTINNSWLHASIFSVLYIGILVLVSFKFVLNEWERTTLLNFATHLKRKISH